MSGGFRRVLILVAMVVIVAGAASWWWQRSNEDETVHVAPAAGTEATYSFVIPSGTGARLDAGEPVNVLPKELDARVGEVLSIVNEDVRGHVVGPFFVGAGQTLTQRFTSAGRLGGACSVHPDGTFELIVSP